LSVPAVLAPSIASKRRGWRETDVTGIT